MFQEYPKWISVPGHKDGGKVVFSREEEADELQGKELPAEVKRKPGRPKKDEQ